jgi:hypothetical protein
MILSYSLIMEDPFEGRGVTIEKFQAADAVLNQDLSNARRSSLKASELGHQSIQLMDLLANMKETEARAKEEGDDSGSDSASDESTDGDGEEED